MEIRKADLYYGSLLSVMINNELSPAIMEQGEKRNVYKVSTNKKDYIMYAKYRVLSKERTDTLNWQFSFSESEIEEIMKYERGHEELKIALVCVNEEDTSFKSEIALLTAGEFKECVYCDGNESAPERQRLNIRYKKGSRGLRAYGFKRPDKLDDKEYSLTIERDRLVKL